MIVKFFFLNMLKTKCNRGRERAFFALSRTLSYQVFKIFQKKNLAFIKSAFVNNLRFFINKCIHLLETSNFGPQGPQNAALQQRYSPCQSEKPKFSGEIENNFLKNPTFAPNFFFLSGLVQNKLKLYVFEIDFMTIQLKLTVPKKCEFRS